MMFTAPLLLLGLAGLPVLWWLLRVTPPAPRSQRFPAIGLLLGLTAEERTSSRTPWWLLLLRMATAALVIVGLAGPVLDAASGLAGPGRLLLVIDDGWAAAPDWTTRMAAAGRALDRAERGGQRAILLTTARSEANGAPAPTPELPVAEVRTRLAALRPKPWPPDRVGAAEALAGVHAGDVLYVADGVASAGDGALGQALAAAGPVREMRSDPVGATMLRPPLVEADRLVARVEAVPQAVDRTVAVLAQTSDGRTLARAPALLRAGAGAVEADIKLPPEIRNEIARLQTEGAPSAGSVVLLDERWRRRPVGLVSEQEGADTPLIGPLFYPRRALTPFTEVRQGDVQALLARPLSVLLLADVPLAGDDAADLERWVEKGGLLIRFAGPRMAEASADADQSSADQSSAGQSSAGQADPLLPVPLLAGDRQLGGALSWSEPAGLAPFAPGSPFAGLTVPGEVTVSRQVLAEPSADVASHTWASLLDGTPLVTASVRGAGRVVLFGVTGNADWSNLPLSGLFVEMLRRLVDLSAGVVSSGEEVALPPWTTVDGFGVLGPPPPAATAIMSKELEHPMVSALHPPGIYGPASLRRALNLGAALPPLAVSAPVPGAAVETLTGVPTERVLGPGMLAVAVLLLALDLLISLGLRGKLRLRAATIGVALVGLGLGLGLGLGGARAAEDEAYPSLSARIAYVQTGDAGVDAISKAGLTGLASYVNRRTAVTLADPAAIVPGQDDLSLYPLLYWPITADAQVTPRAVEALNEFTRLGGVILIDTRDGGSGTGFAPGTEAALKRVSVGLNVPPLTPLTGDHVLARAFYLLQEFPGRFNGDTVWVQRDQDRTNDSVSSVIIGGHDWAAAWATDAAGRTPYATVPGGSRQRTLAYRFGVNLVMYALTGNYKGDQVHVPAILERLGQ